MGRPFEFVDGSKVFDNCSLRFRDKNSFGHSQILRVSKEAISMRNSRIQSFVKCVAKFQICILLFVSLFMSIDIVRSIFIGLTDSLPQSLSQKHAYSLFFSLGFTIVEEMSTFSALTRFKVTYYHHSISRCISELP